MPSSVWASFRRTGFKLGLGGLSGCVAPAPPSVLPESAAESRAAPQTQAPAPPTLPYETPEQIRYRLLEEQDTDCDQRLSVGDQGNRRFRFRLQGQAYDLTGTYVLSNLLQELTIAQRSGLPPRLDRLHEEAVLRTSRLIRNDYWTALTRRLDESGLPQLLDDPKLTGHAEPVLYVPGDDPRAYAYFRKLGQRYDAAYATLERTTSGFAVAELTGVSTSQEKRRVLMAMLRTPEGRDALADVSRRLAAATKTLNYPALSAHLMAALERVTELLEQAARSCVSLSTPRLTRVADRLAEALARFSPKKLSVRSLPEKEQWPDWSASLGRAHGLLSLALEESSGSLSGAPFVVPGGRFNEMYGWDSYFILLGLIADGRLDLARGLVDNFIYGIQHYGATLNANRTYYLTRTQPPFFTSMIRAVWDATPLEQRDPAWLRVALRAALAEYQNVWGKSPRQTSLCRGEGAERACLDRYAGLGRGQPPEVERGHFDWLWQRAGQSLEASYGAGRLSARNLTAELDNAFLHDRCMRESGHDTTYRWFWQVDKASAAQAENHCADMVSVDLNSLLYKYEVDIAHLLRAVLTSSVTRGGGGPDASTATDSAFQPDPSTWCARARHRFELMQTYLWSPQDGLFYDAFLAPSGPVRTGYVSATTLYPLWATAEPCELDAGARPPLLRQEEKSLLVTNALRQLEAPGGLLATAKASRDRFSSRGDRQWDYPNGWAPHQMLAWRGLTAHGFRQDAERLTFSWLYMLLTNVIDYSGTIPEKYDVVARTHAVFSEYGNVGTEFDYIAREGFGWMNASFQVGLRLLSAEERERLSQSVAKR